MCPETWIDPIVRCTQLINWLLHWPTCWLTAWLIKELIDCLIDNLTDRLIDWLPGEMHDGYRACMFDWFTSWLAFLCFFPAGGYVAAMVLVQPRKEVFGVFMNNVGKNQKAVPICSYKNHAYEPRVFLDEHRMEFYFTCTVQNSGSHNADFVLGSAPYFIVATKRNATGDHAANTPSAETKNFVGYTNKEFANPQGYYNKLTDRFVRSLPDGGNTLGDTDMES